MVKEITLKGGDIALVDDEDYPLLSRHSWQRIGNNGYAVTTIQTSTGKNHIIFMHRFIVGGYCVCDHINQNPLDNRKQNLRRATMQQNGWNKGKQSRGDHRSPPTSQYKGVQRVDSKTKGTRWLACLKYVEPGAHKSTGKMIRIGYFATEIEAAKAYNEKVKELRGEWAWVNPIPAEATSPTENL